MTNKDLEDKIDKIIETLLVRPLQTPGAYAETNKLKDAMKALISQLENEARKEERSIALIYLHDTNRKQDYLNKLATLNKENE